MITLLVPALLLAACDSSQQPPAGEQGGAVEEVITVETTAEPAVEEEPSEESLRLAAVLAAQPEDRQARYPYRHPQETLEFFGIVPGMTVVEVLPGGGWYTSILLAYLGAEGHLIGVDYPIDIWRYFDFGTPEFIEKRAGWVETWPAEAETWRGEDGASVEATRFGDLPEDMAGTVDAVLFIRALHNLNRFEQTGGFRTQVLADTMTLLKPGGVVGVVQHRAPDARTDAWADGSHGYLKKEAVVAMFEEAGFEFIGESEINANPADQPGVDDTVWRLPPTLATSKDDPELRAKYEAVGESNRMTLLFRKPLG
jgi:predicted methyltransferase